jgi:TrpR family trp operon transcriptional repressor
MKSLASQIISIKTAKQADDFLDSLFTEDERAEFERRISIVTMLLQGASHREIAQKLGVGIATVSRGANELKRGKFAFLRKSLASSSSQIWWG